MKNGLDCVEQPTSSGRLTRVAVSFIEASQSLAVELCTADRCRRYLGKIVFRFGLIYHSLQEFAKLSLRKGHFRGEPQSIKLALRADRVFVRIIGKVRRPLLCFAVGHKAFEEVSDSFMSGGVTIKLPRCLCSPIHDVRVDFDRHDPLAQVNATVSIDMGIHQIAIQTEWHAGEHIFSSVDVVQGDRLILLLASFESSQLSHGVDSHHSST